jgi:hypothetical protein
MLVHTFNYIETFSIHAIFYHFCPQQAPSLQTIDNLFDEYLNILMKTFLLLYADDTLLFSETYEGMQNLLNVFSDYCKLWKLKVNLSKTKTVIFSKRKFRPPLRLKLDGKELEYTDCFSCLGVIFYYNGSFVHTKKKLVEQAQKALYAVYYKIRNLQLPIDLQLKMFDSLVAYLPNSPYTKQFGVVTLTPKILFVNCKCTFSILSFLPTPQTSLPYNKIGATSESNIFSCQSIGSCE